MELKSMVTNRPREALRQALAERAEAERKLEASRAATWKARSLLETIMREAEDHASAEMRSSTLLADRMKDALKKGEAPAFTNDRELSKSAASIAQLDVRRHATERVIADLVAEEREQEGEVSNATAAVERAVQDVLRDEAEKIAAAWEEVEVKARAIRIRLGGNRGDPICRLSGLSEKVSRALDQTRQDPEFDNLQSDRMSRPWIEFSEALLKSSDARLDFATSDREIEEITKERAERKAADARLVARLRTEWAA